LSQVRCAATGMVGPTVAKEHTVTIGPVLDRSTTERGSPPYRLRNDLAMLCRLVEARLWGLTCVVRYVTPQIFQGEEIIIASGILLSYPALGPLC
jgi:hypothetical protein